MMRNATRVVVLAIGLSLGAVSISATPVYADNVVENLGDWMATMGKKDLEKQAILAQRKAQRQAARAQKETRKQTKKGAKQMDRAGKDLKKGLGNFSN